MLLFICFSSLLATAYASTGYYYPVSEIRYGPQIFSKFRSSAVTPILEQYHTQDTLGQYSYGYSEPLSSKQEYRTADGVTRGSYSYRDADSKIQTVDYIADADGFRVSATNLPRPVSSAELVSPMPVTDTPEVAAARIQHLAAHREAQLRNSAATPKTADSTISFQLPAAARDLLPRPVEDTAEVAAAKREFFKLYEQEKQRHQLLHDRQRTIVQHTLLRTTQPILSAPLSYQSIVVPDSGFRYKIATIPQRKYLPVAN